MAVYVDRMRIPFSGMLMSHMLADDLEELHAMADRIGLRREWFQGHTRTPHYDVCQAKRKLAIEAGAVVIDRRETAFLVRQLRRQMIESAETRRSTPDRG